MKTTSILGLALIGALNPAQIAATPDVRMAAHHRTIVATSELEPVSGAATYVTDRFTQTELHGLVRFVVGVRGERDWVWAPQARGLAVCDVPGAVQATFCLGGTQCRTEVAPLLLGRAAADSEGGVLFQIATSPPSNVAVRLGSGGVVSFQRPWAAWLKGEHPADPGAGAVKDTGGAIMTGGDHSFRLKAASAGARMSTDGATGEVTVLLPVGGGSIVVGFSRSVDRLRSIASADTSRERARISSSFRRLLQARVVTPEPVIDRAFRSALLTLEYNWTAPYGWNECIHHWQSLWHMQHTPAAVWVGQADRARASIMSHADRLMASGAVPQLSPGGDMPHRDFGGSNQFFAWQVQNYWRQTNDRSVILRIATALDRVIEQTWSENDRDGDGLLGWGQQIGNQEDYVSTPSNGTSPTVEGIRMLRTRAELARALGDKRRQSECEDRASVLAEQLRRDLWQPTLGRYAFYRDGLGVVRPDGQYHTLILPAITGLLDPRDAWSGIRHMRDRLTGKRGEVYCSANFACHAAGTWGMQAGAAQQPWAALGLAAVGEWNEAYKPLLAAARWAMNSDHRGAWPEVSVEPTPAYFSPPAGLYVQSVVQAVFGLEPDLPRRILSVSPSFPDAWRHARLYLPEWRASYSRAGNERRYRVESARALSRSVRWRLPVCRVAEVRVNGRRVAWRLAPGVNCVVLSVDTPPLKRTDFLVRTDPVGFAVSGPATVCADDAVEIRVRGCRIASVYDPMGLLSSVSVVNVRAVRGTVRSGLLEAHIRYGRLGQLAFSRRTVFLSCATPDGTRFWAPVTVTVLPPVEAAASLFSAGDGQTRLLLRNNRSTPLSIRGTLRARAMALPVRVGLPARTERTIVLPLRRSTWAMMSPGDNAARLDLGGAQSVDLTIDASPLYAASEPMRRWAASRYVSVDLEPQDLRPDTAWRDWREWYAYGHMPWASSKPPLEALRDTSSVSVPSVPGLRFNITPRRLAPVTFRSGQPAIRVDLGGRTIRKVYALVCPLVDNHDTFTPIAELAVLTRTGAIHRKQLHYPGDLDSWCPEEAVGDFATAKAPRPDRLSLLPILDRSSSDWSAGVAPAFPQPAFWATSRVLKTASCVFNVVEWDLGRPVEAEAFGVTSCGSEAGIALAAVTVEAASGYESLAGSPFLPPVDVREDLPLFDLRRGGDMEGWSGSAPFAVAAVPSLFVRPTLNSLASRGETAVGVVRSPPFTVTGNWLRFLIQGGHSSPTGLLECRLIDAASGVVLARVPAPGSHVLQDAAFALHRWQGRRLAIEVDDSNRETSYAWIGVSSVRLTAR